MKRFALLTAVIYIATPHMCRADVVASWNTVGNAGTETTEPAVAVAPGISGTPTLTLGAGITAAANGNRFGGTGWLDAGDTNPSTLRNRFRRMSTFNSLLLRRLALLSRLQDSISFGIDLVQVPASDMKIVRRFICGRSQYAEWACIWEYDHVQHTRNFRAY